MQMKYFNDSKIIEEAQQVISSIQLKLERQAGFKIGKPESYVNIPKDKQEKVDKLKNLMHYTCYLEKQNHEFFDKFIRQMDKIKMLENHIDNLQNKLNVDNQLKNF